MSAGSHVVRDGVEARQFLGIPGVSLPGIGDLTSILGLPGGDPTTSSTSTTVSTTSVQVPPRTTAISLTLLSRTSSTALSTTSASATSISATSTSASSTASSTLASSTTSSSPVVDSTSATPTPPPSSTNGPTGTATVFVPASDTASSASASASAAAAAAPQSFLQNKALSVGVITTASLVGLVLIIAIATWAIRKRRNERLHQDILDFSNASLVNESHDVEKGGGGSSVGHGSGSSTGHVALPLPALPRQKYHESYAASTPTFVPPPSRNANPYGAPQYASNAYGGYVQNNNWGYGYGNATQGGYDQAYAGTEDAYGGIADYSAMVGVGAGAQAPAQAPANPPQRRPSAQRKPPPALDIPPTNPIAQPVNVTSPISSVSISNPPLQPAAAPPVLPDEFGASAASPDAPASPRRLVVRNE
ncbi:hypothetical protein K466DRAFT_187471 [Polyporus arcularius HHB13444]|uniref:Uncharacterized protein n=1 Tax=Polyporus arcularius HHB13444 TaxID=1314778 RepID=A0A5C3PYB2_9APHY|nr:hypothetical protein K466DRAFT_187471 [Polyporus arcularius HHB13444]